LFNRTNLILAGQNLLKAINKLHRQNAICFANLDRSEIQKARLVDRLPDAGAFFGTNPEGAWITSGLPVNRPLPWDLLPR
jgi:hypothetical protein